MKIEFLVSICMWFQRFQLQSLVRGLEFYNSTGDPNRRILHGVAADPYFFPYFVQLSRKDDSLLCGGSIIHENWILTAAHCFWQEDCFGIKIKSGLWDPTKFINPIECILNDKFKLTRYPFDIGLARVGNVFDGDTKVQKIELPPMGLYPVPGESATIMGWGVTETGNVSTAFLHAMMRVINWEDCNNEWRATNKVCDEVGECPPVDIPNRVVCVRGEDAEGPPSACFGDSGGPVVVNNMLVGVYSFSARLPNPLRCIDRTPSIYTSAVDYLPWIYSFVDPIIDTSAFMTRPEPFVP